LYLHLFDLPYFASNLYNQCLFCSCSRTLEIELNFFLLSHTHSPHTRAQDRRKARTELRTVAPEILLHAPTEQRLLNECAAHAQARTLA
jgi:hypothetical protein